MHDDLVKALRSGQQADEDGVMVKVSRQACEGAADILDSLGGPPVEGINTELLAAIKRIQHFATGKCGMRLATRIICIAKECEGSIAKSEVSNE